MIIYKEVSPEERETKRKEYQEKKLKLAEQKVAKNTDGSVNLEYFFAEVLIDNGKVDHEQLKEFCSKNNINYERIKFYLLIS